MECAIPCGIRVYTDTELWTNALRTNRKGGLPMLWLIVGLIVTASMILLLACESHDTDWVEWRHPPEDDDGIREDDEDE